MACGVDSRLRGNDRTWERPCLANYTSTLGVGLAKCDLLKTGEVPLAEGSLAELRQAMHQMKSRLAALMVETVKRLKTEGSNPALLQQAEALLEKQAKRDTAEEVSKRGLDNLSGIEFEELITRLLQRMGFRAEMTKASGDGGIDVVATLDQPVTGGRYLIQCKRYGQDSPVGAAIVREFCGALTADRRAIKGILITTSGFTAPALEFAGGLPIELIGRDQLQRLLDQHGLHTNVHGPHPGSVVGAAPRRKERAGELLKLAISRCEQTKYSEAIKLLREATRLCPDNPQV